MRSVVLEDDVGAAVRIVETAREGDVGADVRVVETVHEGDVGVDLGVGFPALCAVDSS